MLVGDSGRRLKTRWGGDDVGDSGRLQDPSTGSPQTGKKAGWRGSKAGGEVEWVTQGPDRRGGCGCPPISPLGRQGRGVGSALEAKSTRVTASTPGRGWVTQAQAPALPSASSVQTDHRASAHGRGDPVRGGPRGARSRGRAPRRGTLGPTASTGDVGSEGAPGKLVKIELRRSSKSNKT